MPVDELVGATTTDATTSVSEGSPSSDVSSSSPESPSADRPQPSAKGFAEKAFEAANAGSERPRKGGFIPQSAHDRVLEQQRTERAAEKAAWDAERAQWAEYEWAKQVDRAQLERYAALDQRLATDKVGTIWQMVQAIRQDPQSAQAWRELIARETGIGAQPQQRQAAEEPKPDVRHVDPATGQTYEWYSAPQQAKRDAWMREQILATVRDEFAPLREGVQTFEQMHQQAVTEKVSGEKAQEVFSAVSALPGFSEHKEAIGKVVQAKFQSLRVPAEAAGQPEIVQAILHNAVMQAYAEVVVPKLQEQGRQQGRADLETKARASTRNPKTSGSSAPAATDTRSFAEKAAEMFRRSQQK